MQRRRQGVVATEVGGRQMHGHRRPERLGQTPQTQLATEQQHLGEAPVTVGTPDGQVADAAKDRVGAGQGGAAQGGPRLAGKRLEVVGKIEHGGDALVAASMLGDTSSTMVELDTIDEALGPQGCLGVGDRHPSSRRGRCSPGRSCWPPPAG